MNSELEHLTFQLGEVAIHAVAAGPQDGSLIILLHGFPEFWYGWRGQIAPLASAGLRVAVPDQRGYNQSGKPQDWRSYTVPHLVDDVLGIADRLGREHFMLAGHDWGGIVAWACAMGHQDRVRRLAILNAPHPSVFWKYARTHPAQILRSWYIFFMQLPWLPEFLFEAGNFRAMTDALTKTSRPGTFSEQDFRAYREAWRQPGAPTGMINWYRALRASTAAGNPVIEIPVRILWGVLDRALSADFAELSLRYCKKGELTVFPDATHWLQHEEQAEVSHALAEFFSRAPEC
jgi:pimeloyl-ACP methyl ester carboxylesterase